MMESYGLVATRKYYDEMWDTISNTYHSAAKIFLKNHWHEIYEEYLKKYVLNNHTYQTSILYLESYKKEGLWSWRDSANNKFTQDITIKPSEAEGMMYLKALAALIRNTYYFETIIKHYDNDTWKSYYLYVSWEKKTEKTITHLVDVITRMQKKVKDLTYLRVDDSKN